MTDHAIVIGLDRYDNEAWNLGAAVKDAVAFATWVTAPDQGRASRGTLTLLLSPRDDRPAPGLPFTQATRDSIHGALDRYARKGAGNGAERLWFFYAGHGISESAAAPDDPPVLVPPEATDLDDYLFDAPLVLAKYLGPLQLAEPTTQIFFIDACRDLAESSVPFQGTTSVRFDLSKLRPGETPKAKQAVLYAATTTERALENDRGGLFGRALLEALRGRGPQLRPEAAAQKRVLTFGAVSGFTRRRVHRLVEEARARNQGIRTQDPTPSLFQTTGDDLELARFGKDDLPRGKLTVFVRPATACKSARAGILVVRAATGDFELVERREPPIANPLSWDLAPGPQTVEVSAPGFRTSTETVEIVEDVMVPVRLEREVSPTLAVVPLLGAEVDIALPDPAEALIGLESLDGDSHDSSRGKPLPMIEIAPTSLTIEVRDRMARVELFNSMGELVVAGLGDLELTAAKEGAYRAKVTFPGVFTIERPFLVRAGRTNWVGVQPADAGGPVLPSGVLARLDQHQIRIDVASGFSEPSETFRTTTTSRLGSIMAWAAWAVAFGDEAYGHRLRSLGVEPAASPHPDATSVQVLAGDASVKQRFLTDLRVAYGELGAEREVLLAPVGGLAPFALQWSGVVDTPRASLVVSGPGLEAVSLPVPRLAGSVVLVILTAEPDGTVEVQRYVLSRAHTQGHLSDFIRTSESWARALASHTPLDTCEDLDALFAHPHRDPLTTAIAGYRLAREGKLEEYRSHFEVLATEHPHLPDAHVLLGLSMAPGADGHMEAAARTGVPLVADGYTAMMRWLEEAAVRDGAAPPVPVHSFVGAGAWSMLRVKRASAASSPMATSASVVAHSDLGWSRRLRLATAATVRIENEAGRIVGTGFFAAPDRLLSMGVVFFDSDVEHAPDGARDLRGWSAVELMTGKRFVLDHVLTLAPIPGPMNVAVALVSTCGAAALQATPTLDFTPPRVGQRIALVGHNDRTSYLSRIDASVTTVASAFGSLSHGEKAIMRGTVRSVDGGLCGFSYDCWTVAGSAGGPIVDLESGAIIGIHWGRDVTAPRFGRGIPLAALREIVAAS